MRKRNHPLTENEKVFDCGKMKWGFVCYLLDDKGTVVLRDREYAQWEAEESDVYQIAPGLRTANSGDIVCYEHNETEDNYPYYCPALEENFFSIEVVKAPYDADLTEGSAYELVQRLQDAVINSKDAEVPVFVEDENGRLENITHIWYDHTRHMIRLTVGGVNFEDAPEE